VIVEISVVSPYFPYVEINRHLQMVLKRLIRVLCHLFTLGPLGMEARRFTGTLGDSLYLRDEDLETEDYHAILQKM